MDIINNHGEKIGSITTAISNDKSITINRSDFATTITTFDKTTGEVTMETFLGDSPFGK